MFRPRIRILLDGHDEYQQRYWCGWWPEGWSTIGAVNTMTLAQAVKFYFRVLKSEACDQYKPASDPAWEQFGR